MIETIRWIAGRRSRSDGARRPRSTRGDSSIERLEGRQLLAAGPDPILAWNGAALQAIRVEKTAPPVAARDLAILQLSVFQAVDAADRSRSPASPVAAADAAAHRALVGLFPNQAATFDAALVAMLGALPEDRAKSRGLTLGLAAASSELGARQGDGSLTKVAYTPGSAPGLWVPTPPADAAALLPQWGGVRPFAMTSGSEFRPTGLPSLTSAEYAAAVNQVESLGRSNSTTRTADQTEIANFWADGSGTATPPGHWNEIATSAVKGRRLGLRREARLFATLDAALADAGIAAWDAKFVDNCWRPITAIRAAATDGNPATVADPTWTPLLVTPPFPSYVSGHSTFSAAAATVLGAFLGPRTHFATISDAMPGVTRRFANFNEAADEAGVSRIYGGIHFAFDNRDGLELGRDIGVRALRRVSTATR